MQAAKSFHRGKFAHIGLVQVYRRIYTRSLGKVHQRAKPCLSSQRTQLSSQGSKTVLLEDHQINGSCFNVSKAEFQTLPYVHSKLLLSHSKPINTHGERTIHRGGPILSTDPISQEQHKMHDNSGEPQLYCVTLTK